MIKDKDTAAAITKKVKSIFQSITTQKKFLEYMCYMTYIYTKAIPYDMYEEIFNIVDEKIIAEAYEAEVIKNWNGCVLFCARDYFEDITKVDYRKQIERLEKYYESLLIEKREIELKMKEVNERIERFGRPLELF